MEIYEMFDLQECPECFGPAILEEDGHSYTVFCMDCGGHTVSIDYKTEDQKVEAARKACDLWNMGKIISASPGE